jgi:hypothetical protein
MFTVVLPLYSTRRDLKLKLGWAYSATHTTRLGDSKKYADPFPPALKAVKHRNSHPQWYTPDVLAWLKRRGFPVPENLTFSS